MGLIIYIQGLLDFLNKTKANALQIEQNFKSISEVEQTMNQEIDVYRPYAEFGSRLYFAIVTVAKLNPLYQFSLSNFINIFEKTLKDRTVRFAYL